MSATRQEVNPNYIGPDGSPGIVATNSTTNKTQTYKLFYYGDTRTAQVLPVDASGEVLIDAKPIYTNGVWDTTQFEGLDETTQNVIHGKVQSGIRNHAQSTDQQVPQWADANQQGFGPAVTSNQTALTVEDNKAAGFNLGSFLWNHVVPAPIRWGTNTLIGTAKTVNIGWQLITEGPASFVAKAGIQGGSYDVKEDAMFKRVVTYPMDMSSEQDYMKIDCYSYQPPYEASMRRSFGDDKGKTSLGYGLERQTPYRKKLGAGIILPMPGQNVSDSNETSWVDDNMSTMSMGALQHVNKTIGTKAATLALGAGGGLLTGDMMRGVGLADSANRLAGQASIYTAIGTKEAGRGDIGANLLSQLTGKLGFDITPETILSRAGGIVANSNTELMFSGVKLRSFGFQWRMTPRDEMEAHNIRMIIRAFKQWSAPRKLVKLNSGEQSGDTIGNAGSPSYFLGTPNIFRLRYMTGGGRSILGVNKFKPCALTGISVQYAPDGQWNAYDGGQPISVLMDLKFAELEPIYNTDYSPDVAEGREFDPSNPNSLGDLMPISIVKQDNPSSSDVGY
tara:strand:- start:3482 stop:5170 length:1689 start_codon:yes stop_codon:yes gene_type:complete